MMSTTFDQIFKQFKIPKVKKTPRPRTPGRDIDWESLKQKVGKKSTVPITTPVGPCERKPTRPKKPGLTRRRQSSGAVEENVTPGRLPTPLKERKPKTKPKTLCTTATNVACTVKQLERYQEKERSHGVAARSTVGHLVTVAPPEVTITVPSAPIAKPPSASLEPNVPAAALSVAVAESCSAPMELSVPAVASSVGVVKATTEVTPTTAGDVHPPTQNKHPRRRRRGRQSRAKYQRNRQRF